MINALNWESEFQNKNGNWYDLNILANMSCEDLENLSIEELEGIANWIQESAQTLKEQLQKNKKTWKNKSSMYEQELRSILERKNDMIWIQEFLKKNHIDKYSDIQDIAVLLNKDPLVKKIVMNYIEESLTTKEIDEFSLWLKRKSPSEIQEFFQKRQKELISLFSRHGNKMLVSGWSILVVAWMVLWFTANNPFKNKQSYENRESTEKIDTIKNLDTISEVVVVTPIEKIDSIQQIQSRISNEKMGTWITTKKIMDAVNAIADKEIRIQVIKNIQLGDIVSAQEIFGMKKKTKYKSNRASGIIDGITLERFQDPLFNISGDELLVQESIPEDVKEVYKKFLNQEYSNADLSYIIISKTDFTLYLFAKDNTLLNHQTVLLWAQKGDSKFILHKNASTPWGVYRILQNYRENDGSWIVYVPWYMSNGKYISEDAPGYLLDLLPIDPKTGKYNYAYDINIGALAIHPTPSQLEEKRKSAIESSNLELKRQTGGCVNASNWWIIYDNVSAWDKEKWSLVIITKEHK